jgi:hypothetical protein
MEGWEERESKEGKEKGKNKQIIEKTNKQTIRKKQCQRNKQGEIVY